MRNQNIYTSQITGGLVVGAPGNAKQLGTTTFMAKTVPFQRAFPVEAQNSTAQPLNVRFTIANQPTGGAASFLQFSVLTTLDVTIPPNSSVSRSVFATSTNPQASITVNVAQIAAIGGGVVTNGLTSTAVLNPDITNPNITNPNITNPDITSAEVTNPNITNPNITNLNTANPNITNPNITNTAYLNPNITNPNITNLNVANISATNPNITNLNITNPNITNPNITNPNITNPNITNPDITNGSIQDVIYPITNTGNTTASYTVKTATNGVVPNGILLQLIINKLYQTPVAVNCQLGVQTHWITVANITNPMLFTASNPNITNPDITNATPNEGSVTLAPGETAYITLRVVNPSPATIQFNPLTVITPVTVPQAVNTTTVLSNPGNPNLTAPPVYPPLTVLTAALPATDQGNPGYSFQLQAMGGKPGADTWSIIAGALPSGISLSPSGLITGQTTALGSNSVTIQVADSAIPPNTASKTFTLTVNTAPSITTTSLPLALQGIAYSQPIIAAGGTGTLSFTPLTVDGVTFSSSGTLTGTPTSAGSFQFTATVTDTLNVSATRQLTLVVDAPLSLLAATLASGDQGVVYQPQQLVAIGGTPPYGNWTLTPALNSSLPPGLSLSSTGTIIGTPTASGTYSFSASVTDSLGAIASEMYSITVNLRPTITGATVPLAAVNQPFAYTIPVSNGTRPFTWSQTGALPAGLSLSSTTGVIGGTSTGGSFAPPYDVPSGWTATASNGGTTSITPNCLATVTVTDAAGGSSSANFLAGSTPSSSCAAFGYAIDLNSTPGSGCCNSGVLARTWTFQNSNPATSGTSGVLTFNWQYVGFHAFFEVNALLQVFSGANTITLYQPPQQNCCTSPSGGFNVSGTGSIAVTAGTPFGFTLGGSNFDSNSVLNGTLYITNFTLNPAPQPPTNVAQGPVSMGSIGIIWESSVSSNVTGYNVYRATTSGGPYTNVGSVPSSSFSFTDTAVASGTTYYYIVRAASGTLESANSNEVSIVAP